VIIIAYLLVTIKITKDARYVFLNNGKSCLCAHHAGKVRGVQANFRWFLTTTVDTGKRLASRLVLCRF